MGINASGHTLINNREALPIIFNTTNTERMRILAGGNVGIGATNPINKLHINNTAAATATYCSFTNGTTGVTATDGFLVGINAT